jgi:hypothetical protein
MEVEMLNRIYDMSLMASELVPMGSKVALWEGAARDLQGWFKSG